MVRWDGRPQPHLAVWAATAVEHVAERIAAGIRAMHQLLPATVSWVELRSADELVDVDRPEELEAWNARMGIEGGSGGG